MVGIPFQMVAFACIGYLYGLPDTKRPFAVLLFSTTAQPPARAAARVRARLGHRGQRMGHGDRPGGAAASCSSRSSSRGLRADGLHHLSVVPSVMWEVAEGGGPHRAAHGVPARHPRHGHRRGRRASAHRSWPGTRSPRRSSCSSPSPSTCSRCPASRWSATRSARDGPTRRATSSTTSTAGDGAPPSCSRSSRSALSPVIPTDLHRRPRRGRRARASPSSCWASCSCRLPSPSSPTASSWAANDFRDLRWSTTIVLRRVAPRVRRRHGAAVTRHRHRVAGRPRCSSRRAR